MIEENQTLSNNLKGFNLPTKEFSVLKTEKGIELNMWMMKPKDFDANKNVSLGYSST